MTASWTRRRQKNHRVRPATATAAVLLTENHDRVQAIPAPTVRKRQSQDGSWRKDWNRRLYQAKENVTSRTRKVKPLQH
jgi:hypothetical protein